MIQLILKITIFIALISFSLQQSSQKIDFTVEELNIKNECSKNTQYEFEILGTFNGSPSSLSDTIQLDLSTSDGRKIKTSCTPLNIFGISQFDCKIDTCLYPLDKVNVILPTTAPQTNKFTFKDWEKVIGQQSGVSNIISNVECSPKESANTFIPTSITVEDCLLFTSSFTIKGDWENKDKKVSISGIDILLDNENKDVAHCYYYDNKTPREFSCTFDYGKVKFKEQFFKGSIETYKIKAFDSGKSAKQCSEDFEDDIDKILNDSFYLLNKLVIIFALLLF